MARQSAKGNIVMGSVIAVRRHRDAGRITPAELEKRLSPEAIALLDARIEIGSWYPIDVFCSLLDLDWEIAGHHEIGYLERQGAVSADRLFDSGMYQQLDFAERSKRVDTRKSLERQAKLITTINGALYNFLEVTVELSPTALQLRYANAASFSDALMHTSVGFMNQINHRQGSKRIWSARRVAPDVIVFTMELPERFAE